MMSDQGCDTCEFYFEGSCAVCLPRTGCPHWKAKPEDSLRERLGRYLYVQLGCGISSYLALDEVVKESFRTKADGIMTIMREEKWKP